jgi:hypothetical protein
MSMDCNLKHIQQKQNLIMAEIIENKMPHEIPSMAKANAGLTLG